MNLRAVFYKALNKVCDADITRALRLDTRLFVPPPVTSGAQCRILDVDSVDRLAGQIDAPVDQAFADDFRQCSFAAVGAYVGAELAGLSFYAAGKVASRHNSGGIRFNGIGLELPEGVRYQFKVSVLPSCRGRGLNAAMNACAISYWGTDKVSTLVTTTDWTNESFLKSSERQGFVRYGSAAEIVFAGRHLYVLPRPFEPATSKLLAAEGGAEGVAQAAASRVVRFVKPEH